MASVYPFRPWRYTAKAGPIEKLAIQPYDTIPPDLEEYYRASGPHNLVRLILPRGDYAGAAARLEQWAAEGILARDETPAVYVYEQRFALLGTGERLVRRGFMALGDLEDYGNVVHRHELTLSAPVADRLELLRHTRAQFGAIFMMYPDAEGVVDGLLQGEELAAFGDHQGTEHSLLRIEDPERIAAVQAAMRDKPLVIVDGHHRYEAALRYGRERRVMMAFVPIESPGLRTLAAHRVISTVGEAPAGALIRMGTRVDALDFAAPVGRVRFGMALHKGGLWQIELDRPEGVLNLTVLHDRILHGVLGITPELVRPTRGMDEAIGKVERGEAQAAFLVEPLEVAEVARLALAGKTLPQKSTDFYPKLASGLAIYRFD